MGIILEPEVRKRAKWVPEHVAANKRKHGARVERIQWQSFMEIANPFWRQAELAESERNIYPVSFAERLNEIVILTR